MKPFIMTLLAMSTDSLGCCSGFPIATLTISFSRSSDLSPLQAIESLYNWVERISHRANEKVAGTARMLRNW